MDLYLLPFYDSANRSSFNCDESGLPSFVQKQLHEIKSPHRQQESLVSKLLLVYALANYQSQGTEPVVHWVQESDLQNITELLRKGALNYPTVEVGPQGKPMLKNQASVQYNISHCRSVVACGVHHSPIGVDVECTRKVSHSLIKRVCSHDEQYLLSQSHNPEKEFARLWTRKEAYVKYIGDGIRGFEQLQQVASSFPDVIVQTIELPNSDAYLSVVVGRN